MSDIPLWLWGRTSRGAMAVCAVRSVSLPLMRGSWDGELKVNVIVGWWGGT